MFLKDFLFPKFCLGCGFLGSYICTNCRNNLYYVKKDICLYCSHPSLYGLTHPGCQRDHGVDGFMSIFYYNNLLKTIIKNIKYRFALDVWREFCLVMKPESIFKITSLKKLFAGPIFLEPIPLFSSKLRLRGFNQAKIIAEFFSQYLLVDISSYLIRKKDTLAQAQIQTRKSRFKNMQGAFAFDSKSSVKGSTIILVDDVVTTGSTAKEAAKILKSARADHVLVLSVAHG